MGKDNSGAARSKATANNIWFLVSVGLAELVGTGMLVFMGCAGGLDLIPGHPSTLLDKCFTFGITVAIIIQVFGHVSGAHLNPAVTLSAWVCKAVTLPTAGLYILAQFIGGILGFATLKLMTPGEKIYSAEYHNETGDLIRHGFCVTHPTPLVSTVQALLAEYFATAILILLCCGLWDKRNHTRQDSTPIKFGLAIAALGMAFGPYSGCSMNPARSFGPALLTNDWTDHWIYWVSPLAAGVFVTYGYKFIFERESGSAEADHSDIPLNQTNSKIQSIEKTSTEALATV